MPCKSVRSQERGEHTCWGLIIQRRKKHENKNSSAQIHVYNTNGLHIYTTHTYTQSPLTIIMNGLDKRWYTIKLIVITVQFANSITHIVYNTPIYFALKLCRWMSIYNGSAECGCVCEHRHREKRFCFSYCFAAGIFYLRIILLIQIAGYWNNGIIITATVMVYTVPKHLVMKPTRVIRIG